MEEIQRTDRLVAMDIMEFNPTIGTPEQVAHTASAAIKMARSALGYRQLSRHLQITELPRATMRS